MYYVLYVLKKLLCLFDAAFDDSYVVIIIAAVSWGLILTGTILCFDVKSIDRKRPNSTPSNAHMVFKTLKEFG